MIAWLLIAYFVAVVPVTYFLLRKFKRLEWAWITSPIISLAFAFGFYLFTADLYKASMSRRTSGIVTAEAGNPSARFSGKTDIFFPHGGSYRIAIDSAEILETSNGEGRSVGGSIETVDTGTVEIPALSATNLAYRSIEHEQDVHWGGGVEAKLFAKSDGTVSGTVTNATGNSLSQVLVYLPSRSAAVTIPDIPPGQSTTVAVTDTALSSVPQWAQQYFAGTAALKSETDNSALLLASTGGERFGPQIGRYVGTPNTVDVLVSIPIQGGAH